MFLQRNAGLSLVAAPFVHLCQTCGVILCTAATTEGRTDDLLRHNPLQIAPLELGAKQHASLSTCLCEQPTTGHLQDYKPDLARTMLIHQTLQDACELLIIFPSLHLHCMCATLLICDLIDPPSEICHGQNDESNMGMRGN